MRIIECSGKDILALAEMNKLLIEDENAENSMNLDQLQERMNSFLISGYNAVFFEQDEITIGYALYDKSKTPIYIRQFFICREKRRKGYGKKAFQELLAYINTDIVDIDVYVWNTTGIKFWESLGFEKRCFNMRYNQNK